MAIFAALLGILLGMIRMFHSTSELSSVEFDRQMDIVLLIAKVQIDLEIFQTMVLCIDVRSMARAEILRPLGIGGPGILRFQVKACLPV